MLEKSQLAVDTSLLGEAYERWLKAYQEHDAARQFSFYYPSFRDGLVSTLHLLPHHGRRLNFGPSHRSVASAMLHDWFSVGSDLWGAYVAATIVVHGAASSSEEPEPASTTQSR